MIAKSAEVFDLKAALAAEREAHAATREALTISETTSAIRLDLLRDCAEVNQQMTYIAGIVERGEGKPIAEDETVPAAVLRYVKTLEAWRERAERLERLIVSWAEEDPDCSGPTDALEAEAARITLRSSAPEPQAHDWSCPSACECNAKRTPEPQIGHPEHMLRGEILRLEAEVKRLREAAQMLGSAVGDVLSGWDARRQLDAGAVGMGHNILIEAAGKYTSLSCWIRVRRYYDALCAALNPTAPEPDYKRWWAELAQRPEPQADQRIICDTHHVGGGAYYRDECPSCAPSPEPQADGDAGPKP